MKSETQDSVDFGIKGLAFLRYEFFKKLFSQMLFPDRFDFFFVLQAIQKGVEDQRKCFFSSFFLPIPFCPLQGGVMLHFGVEEDLCHGVVAQEVGDSNGGEGTVFLGGNVAKNAGCLVGNYPMLLPVNAVSKMLPGAIGVA